MRKLDKGFFIHYTLFSTILLFSGYLIFKNLGDGALWTDEASTAIIARNFLKSGQFTAWDGRNLDAIRNGALLDKNLNDRNPPLQFIVTALSFSLFGENTQAARFPFALIGFLTVVLLYLILRFEFRERSNLTLYATAFLGLSTEYILYIRNCRYYSIACFAALLTFFAYRIFVRHASMKTALGLAASASLLYYSHYLICITFVITLAFLYFFFERKALPKRPWAPPFIVCIAFALATVPFSLLHHSWERPDMPQGITIVNHCTILLWYLRDSATSGIAPWSIIMVLLVVIIKRYGKPKIHNFLKLSFLILIGHIVLIGCLSLQDTADKPTVSLFADTRYLVACFPFTAILLAGILQLLHRKSRILALSLATVAIGTNSLYAFPGSNPRHALIYSPLYEYCGEIHHHYTTATEVVTGFLNEHSSYNETFHAWPGWMNGPLNFYLGSRLINCSVLDSNNQFGTARIKTLSPWLLENENFPDWIVFFGLVGSGPDVLRYYSRILPGKNRTPFNYEYEFSANLPVFADESNRPEIFWHHFGEVVNFKQEDHVLIFHKVQEDTSYWLGHFLQIYFGSRFLPDRDAPLCKLQKLYAIYLQDSALVNRCCSPADLTADFRLYRQMLMQKNMPDAINKVNAALARLEHEEGK